MPGVIERFYWEAIDARSSEGAPPTVRRYRLPLSRGGNVSVEQLADCAIELPGGSKRFETAGDHRVRVRHFGVVGRPSSRIVGRSLIGSMRVVQMKPREPRAASVRFVIGRTGRGCL